MDFSRYAFIPYYFPGLQNFFPLKFCLFYNQTEHIRAKVFWVDGSGAHTLTDWGRDYGEV